MRVEKDEPRIVHRSRRRGVQLGEQRQAELIGGQDVETLIADERGGAGTRTLAQLRSRASMSSAGSRCDRDDQTSGQLR
jgi:hypothetical protein